MSTYAEWTLWVGVLMEDVDVDAVSDTTYEILDGLYAGPRKIEGLKIEHIYNQSGIGVVVATLNWNDEQKIFDLKKVAKAQAIVPKLQKIFSQLGIGVKVRIMHYVDVGS